MINYVSVCIIVLFLLPELAGSTLITVAQNESIQAVIYGASRGDTLLVNAGTYHESLDLNKSLILQGVGMPLIDGGGKGQVINLSSGDSSLIGFVIKNSSKSSKDNGCVIITSNNNTIKNNIIENCSSGIALFNCSNNTIDKNNFSNNDIGISLQDGHSNRIANNNAIKNNYGFFLNNSRHNVIDANNASYNNYGIFLNASDNNSITENSFIFSNKSGMTLRYSEGNYLMWDNVSSNKRHGINIDDSHFNTLTNNTASFNKDSGVYLKKGNSNEISGIMANNNDYGIYLYDCRKNILSGNSIKNNREYGIRIFNCTDSSFLENNASNNVKNGIGLISGNNNIFMDNKVNYNKEIGISLKNLKNGMIIGNNACNNTIGLVLLESNDNSIQKNTASYNNLSGISIEFGLNNTIAGNTATNNLGGIIFLNSNKNSIMNNTASNASAAIALQYSSNNTFFGNNAIYNKIGMYLNRSNSNRITENELRKNVVGIALNFSDINSSESNYLSENKYSFLANNNDAISKYGIWKETVISEHMERYLLMHDEAIGGSGETSFVHPIHSTSFSSAKISTGSNKLPVSIDSNPNGAEIWIDGKSSKMLTPNKIILKRKGNHEIELFLSGYESKKETYYITRPTFIKMDLKPIQQIQSLADSINKSFIVSINSTPEGASIWLDENFTGKNTPSIIYFDSAGNHTYELFLSGYETFKEDLNITESESTRINARMIDKKFEAEAVPLTDSSAVPGFLSWCTLLAVILVYYFKVVRNNEFK